MKETPLISIITTAYNIEQYLPMCLDSILAQTFTDFEVLLVDDGSTDKSGTICDEYAKKDRRIHVIHQENKGVSDSWNEALQHVKGEYTGFVDGDDLIHPRMYELLYQAIQKTQSDIAYCGYKKFYGEGGIDYTPEGVRDGPKNDDKIYISSFKNEMANNNDFPCVWRGLYRTELIRDISFLSRRNGQDYFWSTCVLLNANRVTRVGSILYNWRKRIGSESYTAFRYRILDYLVVKRYTVEYLKEHAPEWIVPYTISLFTFCIDAANRIPLLTNTSDMEHYRSEVNSALKCFSQISIMDILRDPYTKSRRKLLATIGKASFPLACFIKKHLLKIVNR